MCLTQTAIRILVQRIRMSRQARCRTIRSEIRLRTPYPYRESGEFQVDNVICIHAPRGLKARECIAAANASISRNRDNSPIMLPRTLRPIRLSRCPQPFDSDDYLFELKIDGFRALAYIENRQCDLVSRNGNTFHKFKDLVQWIGYNLRVENAVLD